MIACLAIVVDLGVVGAVSKFVPILALSVADDCGCLPGLTAGGETAGSGREGSLMSGRGLPVKAELVDEFGTDVWHWGHVEKVGAVE